MLSKLLLCLCFAFGMAAMYGEAIIIDHNCIKLSHVPPEYIDKAKKEFKAAFGHTSHSSQIMQGMEALIERNRSLYNYNWSGSGDALSIWDRTPSGDLGNPNRQAWVEKTREFLKDKGRDRNLIIWAWGNQVSNADMDDIELYLENMSTLEKEFPCVKFVYMTGPLNGTGEKGNLHQRNEQIREFCRANGKILFDFADIESYDPDGKVNYNKLFGRDNCDYINGGHKGNWAREWINKHPDYDLALPYNPNYTEPLNAALKARAFWYMLARLAGWQPPSDMAQRPFAPVQTEAEYLNSPDTTEQQAIAPPKKKAVSQTMKFDQAADYRWWKEVGTPESLIPEKGHVLEIAAGNPAMAQFRKELAVRELEFKVQTLEGTQAVWCVNSDFSGKFPPRRGIAGLMDKTGCTLYVDGEKKVLPGSPKLQVNWPYHFRVVIKDNVIYWGINRKLVCEQQISGQAAARSGFFAIGGIQTRLTISAVLVQWEETVK